MSIGQPRQPGEKTDTRTAPRFQLRRAPRKEYLEEFAVADQRIELTRRDIDKEKHEHPKLGRDETRPAEISEYVLDKAASAHDAAFDQVVDERLDQPRQKYQHRVNECLEEDRIGQRCVIE